MHVFDYVKSVSELSGHVFVEVLLIGFIFYLLFKHSYKVSSTKHALTKEEVEELISSWTPAPLVDPKFLKDVEYVYSGRNGADCIPTICSAAGVRVIVDEDGIENEYLNFISTGFLNYQDNPDIIKASMEVLSNYGVGSCGPRGFYGTTAIHLELESKIAKFMGTEDAAVYNSGLTTITSLVPTFAKFNDYLFVDEGASFFVQNAVNCSRSSNVYWFSHNDPADLRRLLSSMPQIFDGCKRVFVVLEGLYSNTGDVCRLPEILEIKRIYPFRIILEESYSLGVLGEHGRGVTEHYGLPATCVEFIVASLGNALGCLGGFSVGEKQVVSYQRLNSSGYVFSCSMPSYIFGAALKAFELLEGGEEVSILARKASVLHSALIKHMRSLDFYHTVRSPIAQLRLDRDKSKSMIEDQRLLQGIVDLMKEEKMLIGRSFHVRCERSPSPSVFVSITSKHNDEDIDRCIRLLERSAASVLSQAF